MIVGYDSGSIFIDEEFVVKCPAKVTGLCQVSDEILVADLKGSVYKLEDKTIKLLFQIPMDDRENQNLRAFRLASMESPDFVKVIIASGDNGSLFLVNQ